MKMNLRLSALALFSIIVISACGGGSGDTSPVMATGTYPAFITVAPAGKFAYAANWGSNDISVYRINATTGALTAGAAAAAGTKPALITVAPSGKFAYAANWGSNDISVYRIDATTGALTTGTAVAAGINPAYVAIVPSGQFVCAEKWGSSNM